MLNFYRRILSNVAITQAPLNNLLRNFKKNDKRPVFWSDEALLAFNLCNSDIANAATLVYPASDDELQLMVDAFDIAVGAALNCNCLTQSSMKPVAFFSRKTECNRN